MTDFAPEGVVDATPTGEAPAETPAADINWQEKYQSEVQDRIKERERYKPFVQTFGKMHPDDARAVQEFATAFASGDTETAVRWMVDNARTLAGDRFDSFITPAQQQAINTQVAQQAYSDGTSAGMTPEQVEQLVQTRLQESFQQIQQAQVQQQYERQIEETLTQHGLAPDTPLATAAIVAASKRSDLDLAAAIREVEEQVLAQAQQIATRRAEAGTSMGAPIVNGVPVVSPNGQQMTPRERAMARLAQNGL
jgi:hypothetical protein